MRIKSRFTVSAIAVSIALALVSTTAFAAPAQTTGDGGYVASCGIDPTGAALPCAPSSAPAQATGSESFAAGLGSSASGGQSLALGLLAVASGPGSIAEGWGSGAVGANAVAVGGDAVATGADASAFGYASNAFGPDSSAMSYSSAWTAGSVAIGYQALAGTGPADTTSGQVALGAFAQAVGDSSVSIGLSAGAVGTNSVALGTSSVANRANSVSVGDASTGFTRQITNMAGGTMPTDAVDLAQLQAETAALGGGANYSGGIFVAPSYAFGSSTFSDVGSALSYLYSGSITGANVTNGDLILLTAGGSQINAGNVLGPAGPAGPQGTTGATGATGAAGQNAPSGPGSDTSAVHYDTTSSGSINYQSVTLLGQGGTQVHNLAAGSAPTDAANVSQVQQAETGAISTSESYTNTAIAPLDNQISALGLAVSQLSNRLDGLGAAEQASAQMAMACSGDRNCIAAGFGDQSGQGAVAIGFRHSVAGGRAAWTAGVSSSDAGTSVGVGFSINLH